MRRDNELKIGELLTQPEGDIPLPNRMEVNIQLVDEYHSLLLQRIAARREGLDQPPYKIASECQDAAIAIT